MGIGPSRQRDDIESVNTEFFNLEKILVNRKAKKIAALKEFYYKHDINDVNEYYDSDGVTFLVNLMFEGELGFFTRALKTENINPDAKCDIGKHRSEPGRDGFNAWALFSDKLTALQVAVKDGLIEFVQPLLDTHSCDTRILDKEGNTLLHLAARGRPLGICREKTNYVDVVKILLDRSHIDIDSVNNKGKTAEMIAKDNKQFDVYEILLNKRFESKGSIYPINELPTLLSPKNESGSLIARLKKKLEQKQENDDISDKDFSPRISG